MKLQITKVILSLAVASCSVFISVNPTYALSRTARGALTGGAAGAGIGLTTSFFVTQIYRCSSSNRDESCLSNGNSATVMAVSTLGLASVGAGIGALIGGVTKDKDQSMSVIPVVDYNERQGMNAGVVLNGGF